MTHRFIMSSEFDKQVEIVKEQTKLLGSLSEVVTVLGEADDRAVEVLKLLVKSVDKLNERVTDLEIVIATMAGHDLKEELTDVN